jgi:2'-5' RNA ligase
MTAMPSMRLFVAVWPGADACAELRLLHRKDQPGVRFVAEQNWHVTLRFLGRADPREVAAALDGVHVPATRVTLGPVVELLSDHSVIVRAGGLDGWATAVNRATRELGDAPPRRRFVGHLTLARLSQRARRQQAALPRIVGAPFAASFRADEFTLVRSHLDPGGVRYEVLDRWPAGGVGGTAPGDPRR